VTTPDVDGGAQDVAALVRERVRDVPDFPQQGVVFKDIAPLLADPAAFAAVVHAIATQDGHGRVDAVVGIEARGFILAAPVALHLEAGFVPVRKKGKLPGETYEQSYDLEYGQATLQVQTDAVRPGERVLVVDDVLATGGTVEATVALLRRAGAEVVGVSVLLELSFLNARERFEDADLPPVHTLVTV
jgi:adenine phosphoribosyltransferase